MEHSVFASALREAADGLREIEAKYEQLRVKKEQLEALIQSLRAFVPPLTEDESASPAQPQTANPEHVYSDGIIPHRPTWAVARDILAKAAAPMSVPEIYDAILREANWSPAKDAIRIAMIRKPEIFANFDGRYSLKSVRERSLEVFLDNAGVAEATP